MLQVLGRHAAAAAFLRLFGVISLFDGMKMGDERPPWRATDFEFDSSLGYKRTTGYLGI